MSTVNSTPNTNDLIKALNGSNGFALSFSSGERIRLTSNTVLAASPVSVVLDSVSTRLKVVSAVSAMATVWVSGAVNDLRTRRPST